MKRFIFILIVIFLAACGSDREERPTDEPPTVTPSPTLEQLAPDIRYELEEYYTRLRTLHSQMNDIWGALERGETAQCGVNYETLSPEVFTETDITSLALRRATTGLIEAVYAWEAECERPRQTIPPSDIAESMASVRSAGLALDEASRTLNSQ